MTEDVLEDFDLPYSTLNIMTVNADRTGTQLLWGVSEEIIVLLREVLGEPHAEVVIDAEHLAAAVIAGREGVSLYRDGE